ncbi:MAG: hypothetical protein AAGL17_25385, partial [Cyanobacteria bacterium J06576_12]
MTKRFAKISSWQTVHQRNKQFNTTAASLFFLLFCISVAALKLESPIIFLVPAIVWCWLAGELRAYHHSKRGAKTNPIQKTIGSLGVVTAFTLMLWAPFAFFLPELSFMTVMTLIAAAITFIVVIFYVARATAGWWRVAVCLLGVAVPLYLVWFGLELLASPFLLTVVFGTLAGLTRLLRLSHSPRQIECESCDRPLQLITQKRLRPYLSAPQQAEEKIRSKQYIVRQLFNLSASQLPLRRQKIPINRKHRLRNPHRINMRQQS